MARKKSKKSNPPFPRKATERFIVHPITGEMLDHGLVLWFPGNHLLSHTITLNLPVIL